MTCPGHGRHWFTVRGTVGLRAPNCQRCGADNPRPLTSDEWADLGAFLNTGGFVKHLSHGDRVRPINAPADT